MFGFAGGRLEADRLTFMRRDYGAAPKGQPLSKVQERRLREQGSLVAQQSQAAHALSAIDGPSSQEWDETNERCVEICPLFGFFLRVFHPNGRAHAL